MFVLSSGPFPCQIMCNYEFPRSHLEGSGAYKWNLKVSASGIGDAVFPPHQRPVAEDSFPPADTCTPALALSFPLPSALAQTQAGMRYHPKDPRWPGLVLLTRDIGWMENPLQSGGDGHIRSSWLRCLQVDQGLGARLPQAHGVPVLLPAAPPPRAGRSPLQLCPPYPRPPQVTGRHHLPPPGLHQAVHLWFQEKNNFLVRI